MVISALSIASVTNPIFMCAVILAGWLPSFLLLVTTVPSFLFKKGDLMTLHKTFKAEYKQTLNNSFSELCPGLVLIAEPLQLTNDLNL